MKGLHNESHGLSRTSEYKTWSAIKQRCNNENSSSYSNYGGRGISICKEWDKSFDCFIKDMGMKPTINHTIERVNNEEGYNKVNCKWETRTNQIRNRRVSKSNNSGYVGVDKNKSNGKWRAKICVNYKQINLGSYATKKEAINIRKEAELKYWK